MPAWEVSREKIRWAAEGLLALHNQLGALGADSQEPIPLPPLITASREQQQGVMWRSVQNSNHTEEELIPSARPLPHLSFHLGIQYFVRLSI